MTRAPTLEEILATISAASDGDVAARVPLAAEPAVDEIATRIAVAVNRLLDELASRGRGSRRDQEELSAAFESIGEGVITTDVSGSVTQMNPVAEQLTGWCEADARGKRLEVVFCVRDSSSSGHTGRSDQPFRERLIGGLADHAVLVAKGGEERAIHARSAPIPGGRGAVVVFRDRTEELEAARAVLESDARGAAVMEAALDAIIVMDENGCITDFNNAAERTFGYSKAEVLGRSLGDVVVPPALRAQHEAGLRRYRQSGDPRILGRRIELPAMRRDGTEFPAEVAVVRIRSDGPPVFTGYIRDVTERRQAAEAALLRRGKEAAEQANAELETFSYSVAHDLRAPLRAISGFSAVLLEDAAAKLDAQEKKYLAYVADGAQRMSELIDALLSLARLTRVEPKREVVDLALLARKVVDGLRRGESDAERVVDLVLGDDLVVYADPQLARVLLENLLGNAWKYTRKREAARIELGREADASGGPVYFVRDNGAGFDMAHSDKLFAPFRRLHPAAEFEGTGVGLATVQRIVRRHGGRIWAEGAVNEGAIFRFTLSAIVDSGGK